MEVSDKIIYIATLSLVFIAYYFLMGSEDVVGSTMISIILVGIATFIAWRLKSEQRKKGRRQ